MAEDHTDVSGDAPSEEAAREDSGFFDRFAAVSAAHVSRPWFFAACTLSVVIWAVTGPIFGFSEVWQLVINTGTTIITFLLVALLQNSQERETKAMTHKLDMALEALARLLPEGDQDLADELRDMAGTEMEASE